MIGRGSLLDLIEGAALTAALDLRAPELEPIGAGFYSFVFRTARGWIVRVARTPDAARRHQRECDVLPGLAPRLRVAIPHPRRVLEACAPAPFGAIAYPELPGRLMTAADSTGARGPVLARQLAEALAAVHSVDPGSIDAGLVPESDPGHLGRLWATVAPALEQRLAPADWMRVRDWWLELLASDIASFGRRTLVHGDPWWENLMVDDSGLMGMLDWEYLSFSDPANDLGVVLEMGERFFADFLAVYRELAPGEDATLEHRARQLGAARAFYGFEFAIVREDDGEWEDSMESLRKGPILRS